MKHVRRFFAFNRFGEFDPVTKFRLQNAFMMGIGIALLAPVLIVLKGSLLAVWVISIFSIITTLAIKTNSYFAKFRLDTLYKMGIVVHIVLILAALLYFINPVIMVVLESLVGILEVAIFSAYAIVLTNYITKYYPESIKEFQIVRNGSWADAGLIGLFFATLLGFFATTEISIIVFIIYNSIFSVWMIYHWNFFNNPKLKGYKDIKKC